MIFTQVCALSITGQSGRYLGQQIRNLPHVTFARNCTGLWRLDRGSNAVSTERQKQALARFSDDEEAVCDPRLQLMLLNNEKLMKSANTDIVKLSREPPSGTPVAFRRTEVSSQREPLLHEVNLYVSERRAVNSKAIVTKSPRCSNLQT